MAKSENRWLTSERVLGLVLVFLLAYLNWPFLLPLLLGGLFALGVFDYVSQLGRKLKISHGFAVWLSVVLGLFLFWLPLAVATYRVIVYIAAHDRGDASQWLTKIQGLQVWLVEQIETLSNTFGVDMASPAKALLEKAATRGGQLVLEVSTGFLQQLPSIFIASTIFVLSLLFFLLSAEGMKSLFLKAGIFSEKKSHLLIQSLKNSCRTTLFSTVVIGLIQAFIVGLGSLIFDQGDFWLVLIVTFFVSFIPVVGAAPLGFVLALLAYLEGSLGGALGLAAFATVAGFVDNILKPFMVSGAVKTPALLAFTSVVGAVLMLGIPGLILGPVILNMTLVMFPSLFEKANVEEN